VSSDELPFPQSLCRRCAALKVVKSAQSTFFMCTALPNKYPPQPVRQCPAFRGAPPTS